MVDHSIPVGPTPEEEAALLTPDRTSEQFYGQPPLMEQGDAEPATAPLPPWRIWCSAYRFPLANYWKSCFAPDS